MEFINSFLKFSIGQYIDNRDFGKMLTSVAMESDGIKVESPTHKVARETGNDLALNAAELTAGYTAGYYATKAIMARLN